MPVAASVRPAGFARVLLAAIALAATGPASGQPGPAPGQPPASPPASALPSPAGTPATAAAANIRAGLNQASQEMSEAVKQLDALAAHLKEVTNKSSAEVSKEVFGAEQVLGIAAEKLSPQGNLAAQLNGLREAGQRNLERIQKLPPGVLEETDRNLLLSGWQKVLQDCDNVSAERGMLVEQIKATIGKLRRREAAVSELLLLNEFSAAIASLRHWIADFQNTLEKIHKTLDTSRPLA